MTGAALHMERKCAASLACWRHQAIYLLLLPSSLSTIALVDCSSSNNSQRNSFPRRASHSTTQCAQSPKLLQLQLPAHRMKVPPLPLPSLRLWANETAQEMPWRGAAFCVLGLLFNESMVALQRRGGGGIL